MKTRIALPLALTGGLAIGWWAAHASNSPASGAPPAVHIPASEISAAVAAFPAGPVGDRALSTIPVGSYNLSVAVVRRATDGVHPLPPDAIVHDKITEVYQVLEGSGVLVSGGRLVDGKRLPPEGPLVRNVIGPSTSGTRIEGGLARRVSAGDIVVIPPNTPHGFVEIGSARIVYTLVRIDGDRVLEIETARVPRSP
jgi:mannose-6-phosphate isomerase-like protein (cupin superfamily)